MQFLKTFGLLLLLTLGNTGIASEFENTIPSGQESYVDFQFSENHQNLFESILNTPAEVQTNRTIIPAVTVPEHLCPRRISQANSYFIFSHTLIPSLDISAIIFPFHSFL